MDGFPNFYDPERIGTLFYPDVATIAHDAAGAELPPSDEDSSEAHLVIIDMQVDFCHSEGNLFVPGAQEDIRRLIEFIYRNAPHITRITCSLDSHVPYQIFHPAWWADKDGRPPEPYTLITYDDVKQGRWRPLVAPEHSREYVRKLEQQAKKQLTIWPYHVGIGGVGNALDPELWSAVMWHSLARKTQPTFLTKGSVPETEHYSIIQPEIPVPDHPQGRKNETFLNILEQADTIVIAGEAKSHCVLETVEDLVQEFGHRPEVLRKIHFLEDCTSPVAHPEIDFDALAEEQLAAFAEQGINLISSTDPLPGSREG